MRSKGQGWVLRSLAVLASTFFATAGCDPGPHVVLNQRGFELPSTTPTDIACFAFDLGRTSGDGKPSFEGANQTSSLIVRQATGPQEVVVSVTEGLNIVVQRTYDESFFHSGKLDEFTASSTTGQSLELRYWGQDDSTVPPECAPAEAIGP
jgi:hypothetical protein